MGQSTNGQLCFGVQLTDPEGGLPWLDAHGDDPEAWWRETRGFVNPHPTPFDDKGSTLPRFRTTCERYGYKRDILNEEGEAMFTKHCKAERAWDKANPMPFEVINVCSGDCPMYVLAVPGSAMSACRGDPEDVNIVAPHTLRVAELLDALAEHGIEHDGKPPRWILSSLWM